MKKHIYDAAVYRAEGGEIVATSGHEVGHGATEDEALLDLAYKFAGNSAADVEFRPTYPHGKP